MQDLSQAMVELSCVTFLVYIQYRGSSWVVTVLQTIFSFFFVPWLELY